MRTVFPLCLLALLSGNAAAEATAGEWLVRAGPYLVSPKSDNSDIVDVDDGISLGCNFTYRFTEALALEVLASTPFGHDIELKDGTEVGDTKHLPPTVSLQYHWLTDGPFRPYAGAEINWTLFFDEDTSGPLSGSDLSLDDSLGLALQVGADLDLNDDWFVNVSVRYIDIDTDAALDGVALTEVEIDPWVLGAEVGYRF